MIPLLHHGMVMVGVPYSEPALNTTQTGGTPYGVTHVSGVTNDHPLSDDEITLAKNLGERLAQTALKLSKIIMKVICFNANGIRAAARNGFYQWLAEQDADFVCIQETKAHAEQLLPEEMFYPQNYFCEYYSAQKGYSGVAIYARHKPTRIVKGIGYDYCDERALYTV